MSDSRPPPCLDATATLDGPPTVAAGGPPDSRLRRGDTIGRFTVLEHLGTGGMGQVYAAYDPRLDRKIALKILRPWSGSRRRGARARLLREARALARLNDPNVLTLFDVGTFGDQVFLATEYVPGVDLGRWLRGSSRTVPQILEIFRQAGRGLIAAHEAGLVHRDFKLGNVMVRPDGRALVLDFGLARSGPDGLDASTPDGIGPVDDGAGVGAELTRAGARIGTPRFMAPEQWAGEPAGPAADQFSFCVALWQALHGEPPFEPPADPRTPPTWTLRAPPVGAPAVPPRTRRAMVRGLSRRAEDRYPSMRVLLDHLLEVPARRWRRRITGGLLAASVVLALWRPWQTPVRPCSGAGERLAEVWDGDKEHRLRAALIGTGRAFAEDTARSAAARLQRYGADWTTMYRDTCESTHVRGEQSSELLDRRMACLDRRRRQLGALVDLATAEPEAIVDDVVSAVEGLPTLDACADTAALLALTGPPSDPRQRRAADALGDRLASVEALLVAGRYDRAEHAVGAVLAEAEALGHWPLVADVLVARGRLHGLSGSAEAARATFERALQAAQAARHERAAAEAFIRLVRVAGYDLAEFAAAERYGELAGALIAGLDRSTSLDAALADHLGVVALHQGDYGRAATLHERALALRRQPGRDDGPAVATTRVRLGNVRFEQGDLAAAANHFLAALAVQEQALGSEHPALAATLDRLGAVAHRTGELGAARAYFERALGLLTATFGDAHPQLAGTLGHLANVRSSEGDPAGALALYDRVLALHVAEHGERHPWVGITWVNIGETRGQMADHEGAIDALDRALDIVASAYGDDHPLVAQVLGSQGAALAELGRFAEAERLHRRALDIQQARYDAEHPLLGHTWTALAQAWIGLGRSADAERALERALDIWSEAEIAAVHVAWARWLLARSIEASAPERAVRLARDAAEVLRADTGDHGSTLAEIDAWLARHGPGSTADS